MIWISVGNECSHRLLSITIGDADGGLVGLCVDRYGGPKVAGQDWARSVSEGASEVDIFLWAHVNHNVSLTINRGGRKDVFDVTFKTALLNTCFGGAISIGFSDVSRSNAEDRNVAGVLVNCFVTKGANQMRNAVTIIGNRQ